MPKEIDFEEAIVKFAQEGVCDWCGGEKKITHDAGKDNEWTERCPVCNPVPEEDPDSWRDNEQDR